MAKTNEALQALRTHLKDRKSRTMVHDDFMAGYDAGYNACLARMMDILTMPLEDLQKDAADKAATLSAAGELTPNLKVLPLFYLDTEVPVNV